LKILCVIDSLGSGGAQRQLVNLAIGFKEKGHEVSFLVYHNLNFFQKQLDEAQIKIHYIVEPNYLKRLLKFRKFLRRGNQDAVLSFLEASNFMCEIAGLPFRKWKLVVGERSANPNILKSFKLRAYRWFHLFADYVVANSNENISMVKKLNPLIPNRKFKVIYNKVDLNKWKPKSNEVSISDDTFKILVIANHQPLKNALGLIKAVQLLPDFLKKKLSVHWYGRQDSHEVEEAFSQAIDLVKEYKLDTTIQFFPPTSEIHNLIHNYNALGLFSFYEGFPNTICEGMAAGKSIVASSVSDVPIFIEEGINGYLCDPNEAQSIANALIKAVESPKELLGEMGKRNREKAEDMFSTEKTVDMYLELFHELSNNNKTG